LKKIIVSAAGNPAPAERSRGTDIDPVEVAIKQRHLYLLSKIKTSQPLNKKEIEELTELEHRSKKQMTRSPGQGIQDSGGDLAAEQIITTQKEAAKYAGVSTRTIRRWTNAGMSRTEAGCYIKSMLDFYRAHEGSAPTKDKERQQTADADAKEVKAKLLAMELELKQGQLVHRDEMERENIRKIITVKRALLGQGRKLASRLARLKDPRKIQALIDAENRTIIEGFASS